MILPYWAFWETSFPGDLRRVKRELLSQAVRALGAFDVVTAIVADELDRSREDLAGSGADAILVLQSMAVPPGSTLQLLDVLPSVPVVVWAIHERSALPASFDHSDITREGATVGTPQLLNVLQRQGRGHLLVVGHIDDLDTIGAVEEALFAAGAARRLQSARLGRVGKPLQGYDCVDADDSELEQALGLTVVRVPIECVREAYLATPEGAIADIAAESRGLFTIAPELDGSLELERSFRLASALERIDRDWNLDMGAINCHVAELRFSDDPGVTPCFALGRETSRGIPWTCTGDVLTAVAMWTTRILAGCAVYHEIEALDHETNEVLLANSGEHDLGWAEPGNRPLLHRNPWFARDTYCGACAAFGPRPGNATLVAFTTAPMNEANKFRFVVAEGELTSRAFPCTGTIYGAFRFGCGGERVSAAWARWAGSGVNHHASATPGHVGKRIEAMARLLGLGHVRVS